MDKMHDLNGLCPETFESKSKILYLSKVSLSCLALASAQVQVIGSPEWQAYKNAELALIAPSQTPLAHIALASQGINHAQELLAWEQANLVHTANAQAFVAAGAGRRKRQVSVVDSPEWQAWKNAELAHIAPSIGPLASQGINHALAFIAPVTSPRPSWTSWPPPPAPPPSTTPRPSSTTSRRPSISSPAARENDSIINIVQENINISFIPILFLRYLLVCNVDFYLLA